MPPKTSRKEAPLPAALADRLNDLTARHKPNDDDAAAATAAAEQVTTVEDWKSLGNACFANGSHLTAIRCYTRAIADIPTRGGDTAVLRSNRSAAYLASSMLSGPALALKDAEAAVAMDPSWFKAHVRVGEAQLARRRLEESAAAYEAALARDPSCAIARAALKGVRQEMFLRKLDLDDKAQRRAEEEACELLKATDPATAAALGGGDELRDDDPSPRGSSGRRRASASGRRGDNSHSRNHDNCTSAEKDRPFEFHNAPLRFQHNNDDDGGDGDEVARLLASLNGPSNAAKQRQRPPTEEETARLVRAWTRELVPRDNDDDDGDNHNALVAVAAPSPGSSSPPRPATGAGLAYRERMLSQFRGRVSADPVLDSTLRARREAEQLSGAAVDYRDAERHRTAYQRSTNGIGLAISTDAYKEHAGIERSRW